MTFLTSDIRTIAELQKSMRKTDTPTTTYENDTYSGGRSGKFFLLLFTWEKNGLNKKDLFFNEIEESVIRFSVRCKENELHRKYMGLGGSTENASQILEIEQNWFFHWI